MDLNNVCRRLPHGLPDCFDRISAVYAQMDTAYAATARQYGFVCRGCEDNCCLTRFRHHTLIECAYLRQGFTGLDMGLRQRIADQARTYRQILRDTEARGAPFRHWCPLNQAGRCILYTFRPMICRLHGVAHILHHPLRGVVQGRGCHIFEEQCLPADAHPLDRSGIYQTLAGLERAVRQATGCDAPIRMTIADMILTFVDGAQAERHPDGR